MKKIASLLIMLLCLGNIYTQDIFTAIEEDNLTKVKSILDSNPEIINAKNNSNLTPLNKAAAIGKSEIALELINRGADINIGDQDNTLPIHHAAMSGSREVFDILLSKGFDIDITDNNKLTPLFLAVQGRQTDMALYLINKGADVKIKTLREWPILLMAAITGDVDVAKKLVEKKAKVDEPNNNGLTPLFSATSFGNIEMVKFLVENGADVNHENSNGEIPIHWALNENTAEGLKFLIGKGAKIDKKNNFGSTPFLSAARRGYKSITEIHKQFGADIHTVNYEGWNALTYAAYSRKPIEIAKWLIMNGVNPNPKPCFDDKNCTCGPSWRTPLHTAAMHGGIELAKILVSNNAKVNIYDNDGLTPLHYSIRSKNKELAGYLIKSGAFLSTKETTLGNTELHMACMLGCPDIAKLLIGKGSDVNILNDEGKTALELAYNYGHKDIAYQLLANGANDTKLAKLSSADDDLKTSLNEKEAKVWFLGHSGWAVKTKNHFMIFDYFINNRTESPIDSCLANGYIKPEELKDLKVTVFSTHSHGDHYSKDIFKWKETIADIEYVLCFNPNDLNENEEYNFIPIHGEKTVHGIKISTIASTDLDGAYFIEVDGLNIFHAGDHANGEDNLMKEFTDEVDIIAAKNKPIDILFGGIRGCSLGRPHQVKLGIEYMIEKLNPKLFVPMHAGEFTFNYKKFVDEIAAKNYDIQYKYVVTKGDRFTYKDGILHN